MMDDVKVAFALVILLAVAALLRSGKYTERVSVAKVFVVTVLSGALFWVAVFLVDFSRGNPVERGEYYDFGLFLGGASVYFLVHAILKLYDYWQYHALLAATAVISIVFSIYDHTAGIVLTLAGGIILDYVIRLIEWFLEPESLRKALTAALKWIFSPWKSKKPMGP